MPRCLALSRLSGRTTAQGPRVDKWVPDNDMLLSYEGWYEL